MFTPPFILVLKKLEIEKTKPTFIISTFKTDIIKVGLVFSISNFFISKTSLANNWRSFSSSYSALTKYSSQLLKNVNESTFETYSIFKVVVVMRMSVCLLTEGPAEAPVQSWSRADQYSSFISYMHLYFKHSFLVHQWCF